MKICVSIASYRDPDLKNTVSSALSHAHDPDNIEFCVVSQDFDNSHPDLSFAKNLNYHKYHWSKSRGVCWARNIALASCDADYIFQVDSHSRFPQNWDHNILKSYNSVTKKWGDEVFVTQYPFAFKFMYGEEIYIDLDYKLKTGPVWDKEKNNISIGLSWTPVQDAAGGDEVYHIAGGCTFAEARIFKEVLPDPEIYFSGEETSIAMRAYSRGIKMITTGTNFIYSNFDRDNYERGFHWSDHKFRSNNYEQNSRLRLAEIYSGRLRGYWGIDSLELHKEYLQRTNMEFLENLKSL